MSLLATMFVIGVRQPGGFSVSEKTSSVLLCVYAKHVNISSNLPQNRICTSRGQRAGPSASTTSSAQQQFCPCESFYLNCLDKMKKLTSCVMCGIQNRLEAVFCCVMFDFHIFHELSLNSFFICISFIYNIHVSLQKDIQCQWPWMTLGDMFL